MAKTPAERQQSLYERRKQKGLVLLRAWLHPLDLPLVKRYIERLAKRRSAK